MLYEEIPTFPHLKKCNVCVIPQRKSLVLLTILLELSVY